ADIEIQWINSETLDQNTIDQELAHVDGIIVPSGFGKRGIEGMIEAIRYARENQKPFLGIGLGMQLAAVEVARHVLRLEDAHTTEVNPNTPNPIVDVIVSDEDAELRLGNKTCQLIDNTKTK